METVRDNGVVTTLWKFQNTKDSIKDMCRTAGMCKINSLYQIQSDLYVKNRSFNFLRSLTYKYKLASDEFHCVRLAHVSILDTMGDQ